MIEIIAGYADLDTGAGSIPIAVLGEGKIESTHPLYEDDLSREYIVYASLHESRVYGTPAFWFGMTEVITGLMSDIDKAPRREVMLLTAPSHETRLHRVGLVGTKLAVDKSGLATYTFGNEQLTDEVDTFTLIPDGYR